LNECDGHVQWEFDAFKAMRHFIKLIEFEQGIIRENFRDSILEKTTHCTHDNTLNKQLITLILRTIN
jgi:hypothetical protein